MKPLIQYKTNVKGWRCFSVIELPGFELYAIGWGSSPIEAFHNWELDFIHLASIKEHIQ